MNVKEVGLNSVFFSYPVVDNPLSMDDNAQFEQTSKLIAPMDAFSQALQKSLFPKTLCGVKVVNSHLGGSTGAKLVGKGGQQWVQKGGSKSGGVGHLVAEYHTNKVYKALGVPVPEVQLYNRKTSKPILKEPSGKNDLVMLAQFIKGVPLKDYLQASQISQDSKEKVIKQLQAYFVLDCLLANWDVIGLDMDNVIVTREGIPYRIDNGSGFEYRAQGELKGVYWGDEVHELVNMRDPNCNFAGAQIYGSLSDNEIIYQIDELNLKKDSMLAVMPEKYHQHILNRLAYLDQIKEQLRMAEGTYSIR